MSGLLLSVPEEFVGVSLGELNAREGRINGMEAEEHNRDNHRDLAASAYDALIKAIGMGYRWSGPSSFG